MGKAKKVSVFVCVLLLSYLMKTEADEFKWQEISQGNLGINTVLIHPDNPHIIYFGSKNGIYKTEDGGLNWRNLLFVRGQNTGVNLLLFDSKDKNSLYAATGNGLFYTANQGKNWKKIYKGKNYLENECSALAVLPDTLYLGTRGGLFKSIDKGRRWFREKGKLGNNNILAIASNLKEPNYIYIVCIEGVMRSKNQGESWDRIFIRHSQEDICEVEEMPDDEIQSSSSCDLRYICIDPNNLNCLYLATAKGVYKSMNRGSNWKLTSGYGLLNRDVTFLLLSGKSDVYAATKSGVFQYQDERWQEISFGLSTKEVKSLYLDNRNNIFIACNKGLFKTSLMHSSNKSQDNILSLYYKDEPEINEICEAAIRYAEVTAEKIKQWRSQAAKKAWLPEVRVGVNRNSSDLWHWEAGSTTKNDDDVLRKGRAAVDLDISLSWDLSELIYNSDQTSIDVRSRLMVQLRDEILDEVIKLYFERIRVKMELDNLSIEDRKKRFEQELKLQELTASLDALTNGYLSQHIKVCEKK